ncbi:unnamed protein product [Prorocentrum cordatum]|uniref:Uncharacterized protein n=1 Tax=Prorocentrum cordatum TaxID=2364126 RepID=A0ABN9XCZ5_9DINO|nr:unnamed protein product [Polarella glacialis]
MEEELAKDKNGPTVPNARLIHVDEATLKNERLGTAAGFTIAFGGDNYIMYVRPHCKRAHRSDGVGDVCYDDGSARARGWASKKCGRRCSEKGTDAWGHRAIIFPLQPIITKGIAKELSKIEQLQEHIPEDQGTLAVLKMADMASVMGSRWTGCWRELGVVVQRGRNTPIKRVPIESEARMTEDLLRYASSLLLQDAFTGNYRAFRPPEICPTLTEAVRDWAIDRLPPSFDASSSAGNPMAPRAGQLATLRGRARARQEVAAEGRISVRESAVGVSGSLRACARSLRGLRPAGAPPGAKALARGAPALPPGQRGPASRCAPRAPELPAAERQGGPSGVFGFEPIEDAPGAGGSAPSSGGAAAAAAEDPAAGSDASSRAAIRATTAASSASPSARAPTCRLCRQSTDTSCAFCIQTSAATRTDEMLAGGREACDEAVSVVQRAMDNARRDLFGREADCTPPPEPEEFSDMRRLQDPL